MPDSEKSGNWISISHSTILAGLTGILLFVTGLFYEALMLVLFGAALIGWAFFDGVTGGGPNVGPILNSAKRLYFALIVLAGIGLVIRVLVSLMT